MRPDHAGGLTNPYDSRGSSDPGAVAGRWSAGVTRAVVAGVLGVGASVGLAAAGAAAAHADESEVGAGADAGAPEVVESSGRADVDDPDPDVPDPEDPVLADADIAGIAGIGVDPAEVRRAVVPVEVDPVVVTQPVPAPAEDRVVVPVPAVGAGAVRGARPDPLPVTASRWAPEPSAEVVEPVPVPEREPVPLPAADPGRSEDLLPAADPVRSRDRLLAADPLLSEDPLPGSDPVLVRVPAPEPDPDPLPAAAATSGGTDDRVAAWSTGTAPAGVRAVVLAGGTAGPPVVVRPVADPRDGGGTVGVATLPGPGAVEGELPPSPALRDGTDPWSGGAASAPAAAGTTTWSVSARDLLTPWADTDLPQGHRAAPAGAGLLTTDVATTAVLAPVAAGPPVFATADAVAGEPAEPPTTTAWGTVRVPGATTVEVAAAPGPTGAHASAPAVLQVDFAPDADGGNGTGVVLDPGAVDPSLRIPGADGQASYVLTVKHGLPIDSRGEVVGPVRSIAVLRPRAEGEDRAQPLPGTVSAVRVSGSSDLALLVVRGDRTGIGPGSQVAPADLPVGTDVHYVGVNPTGETTSGSGQIVEGPQNRALGNNAGTRWGNPVTTSIPSQTRGNSGGPLLDADGRVLGVLAGFDTGLNALISGGRTYFISTGDLLRFLHDRADSTLITLPSTVRTRIAPQP